MGTSSSKFKSRSTKIFKRASFRSKKKPPKDTTKPTTTTDDQTPVNGNGSLPQNGSTTNVVTPTPTATGNGSLQHITDPPAAPPSAESPANGTTTTATPTHKEKSRSIAHLLRRTGSMRSAKSSAGSTFSLKRFGSLKSIGSRRSRRRAKAAKALEADPELEFSSLDPAEIPPINECHFTKLYDAKIHQKIFQYFTFQEKMRLRAVCKRWQVDLFKETPGCSYPLFRVPVPPEVTLEGSQQLAEDTRQAMASSNRYLYYCSTVQTLRITERLTKALLENLCKYCFSKSLKRIEFTTRTMEKCDIIASHALELFSAKFGRQLEEVSVETRLPDGVGINNDLTDVILFLLYTNSEHFDHLVYFQLPISNKLTNGYFQMFQSEFGAQLRHLAVELCFDVPVFISEASKTLERIGSTMEGLRSLSISILPKAVKNNTESESSSRPAKLSIQALLDLIELLPSSMQFVEQFTLAVDIAEIDCFRLDLIRPLSRFTKAKELTLTVYGDLVQMEHSQLHLDFSHLELNHALRRLTLDSAKISDLDVENLVTSCPNLRHLILRCDVRVTLTSIYQIATLAQLRSLQITQCTGPLLRPQPETRRTSGPLATKEALFIDNDALVLLLSSVPTPMRSLRTIRLENCRIDMENCRVLEQLISFTCHSPDETFTIRLAHNRYPLTVVPKFYRKFEEYIPKNLILSWR